jgi:hypothetical protein
MEHYTWPTPAIEGRRIFSQLHAKVSFDTVQAREKSVLSEVIFVVVESRSVE